MKKAVEPNVPTTSGKTPNYGLPQWEGGDVTNWFELNPAFSKIDEAMHANEQAAQTAQSTGDSNTASIGNLTEIMNNTISRVTSVENVNTQQTQQITLNITHLNEHDTAIQNNTAAIEALQNASSDISGDVTGLQTSVETLKTNMSNVQQAAAMNADHIGDLNGLETIAKNNIVLAINEIIGGTGGESGSLAQLGNLAELMTTAKDTLVAAINELYTKPAPTPSLPGKAWVYKFSASIGRTSSAGDIEIGTTGSHRLPKSVDILSMIAKWTNYSTTPTDIINYVMSPLYEPNMGVNAFASFVINKATSSIPRDNLFSVYMVTAQALDNDVYNNISIYHGGSVESTTRELVTVLH